MYTVRTSTEVQTITAVDTAQYLLSNAKHTRSPAIAEGPRDAGVPVEIW